MRRLLVTSVILAALCGHTRAAPSEGSSADQVLSRFFKGMQKDCDDAGITVPTHPFITDKAWEHVQLDQFPIMQQRPSKPPIPGRFSSAVGQLQLDWLYDGRRLCVKVSALSPNITSIYTLDNGAAELFTAQSERKICIVFEIWEALQYRTLPKNCPVDNWKMKVLDIGKICVIDPNRTEYCIVDLSSAVDQVSRLTFIRRLPSPLQAFQRPCSCGTQRGPSISKGVRCHRTV